MHSSPPQLTTRPRPVSPSRLQRGAHPSRAADPEGWPRNVMRVLEVLLAAGLRPVVYQVGPGCSFCCGAGAGGWCCG